MVESLLKTIWKDEKLTFLSVIVLYTIFFPIPVLVLVMLVFYCFSLYGIDYVVLRLKGPTYYKKWNNAFGLSRIRSWITWTESYIKTAVYGLWLVFLLFIFFWVL